MSISIGDALLKLGVDTKDLDRGLQGIQETIKKHQKAIGLAMVGMGTAIVGSLTMCMKAAAEEEAGIERLRVAMRNMGLSYDETRESLENWINTMQQKTSIADDQQRSSLASLIRMTGDLTQAQDLLTLAMDMSVGLNEDLEAATTKVMYALGGNWGMVERYIPALKSCITEEEKWAKLRQMFARQAEAYGQTVAGQMQLLKANISDVAEAIGSMLLPVIKSLLDFGMPILELIKNWMASHQELAKVIVLTTGAIGGLLIVGGGLLILLPSIATGIGYVVGMVHALNISLGILLGLLAAATLGLAMMAYGTYQLVEYKKLQAKYAEMMAAKEAGEIERYKQLRNEYLMMTGQIDKLTTSLQTQGITYEQTGQKAISAIQATQSMSQTAIQGVTMASVEGMRTVEEEFTRLGMILTAQMQAYLRQFGGPTEAGWVGGGAGMAWTAEQQAVLAKYGWTAKGLPGYVAYPGEAGLGYPVLTAEEAGIMGYYQHGGLVTRPTLAMLGEAGPEMVVPLQGGGRPIIQITLHNYLDGREIGRTVIDHITEEVRLQGGF